MTGMTQHRRLQNPELIFSILLTLRLIDSPVISFSFESNQIISEQVYKNRRRKKVLTGSMRKRDECSESEYSDFPYRDIVPENGENNIEITSIYKYNEIYLLFKRSIKYFSIDFGQEVLRVRRNQKDSVVNELTCPADDTLVELSCLSQQK